MARYNLAATKTSAAAAGLIGQLRCANAARDARIWEVGIFATTAASGTIGLTRPSAVGSGFTSVGPGQAEDNVSGAGAALIDTAASTAPTIPSTYMRQAVLPASIGAGMVWTFPSGLMIPAGGALALWQISTSAVGYAMYFVYDE